MMITLNGQRLATDKVDLTYEDIVKLAYGHHRREVVSIVWHLNNEDKSQTSGIIGPGETLHLKEGMRISACVTSNA